MTIDQHYRSIDDLEEGVCRSCIWTAFIGGEPEDCEHPEVDRYTEAGKEWGRTITCPYWEGGWIPSWIR